LHEKRAAIPKRPGTLGHGIESGGEVSRLDSRFDNGGINRRKHGIVANGLGERCACAKFFGQLSEMLAQPTLIVKTLEQERFFNRQPGTNECRNFVAKPDQMIQLGGRKEWCLIRHGLAFLLLRWWHLKNCRFPTFRLCFSDVIISSGFEKYKPVFVLFFKKFSFCCFMSNRDVQS
jgi:hypothetical protein